MGHSRESMEGLEQATDSRPPRNRYPLAQKGISYVLELEKPPAVAGKTRISKEVRDLIRTMSLDNSLWDAPRIHGELLKLGTTVSQTTVSKYMAHHRKPPSQSWRTFLKNHAQDIVSVDFFTVPTATFHVLYVFVILSNARRRIVHFNVTEAPTAVWSGQ